MLKIIKKEKMSTKQNGETFKGHMCQKYFNFSLGITQLVETLLPFLPLLRAYTAHQGSYITWKKKVP